MIYNMYEGAANFNVLLNANLDEFKNANMLVCMHMRHSNQ